MLFGVHAAGERAPRCWKRRQKYSDFSLLRLSQCRKSLHMLRLQPVFFFLVNRTVRFAYLCNEINSYNAAISAGSIDSAERWIPDAIQIDEWKEEPNNTCWCSWVCCRRGKNLYSVLGMISCKILSIWPTMTDREVNSAYPQISRIHTDANLCDFIVAIGLIHSGCLFSVDSCRTIIRKICSTMTRGSLSCSLSCMFYRTGWTRGIL